MTDTQEAEATLHGPAWTGPFFLAAGLAVVCVAIGLTLAHLGVGGALVGLAGLGSLGLGVRILRHPTTLILAPEGLSFVNLGIRRRWAWRDVGSFRIEHVRSAKVIIFEDYSRKSQGQINALPMRWGRPPREVVDLLLKAKDRWGSSA